MVAGRRGKGCWKWGRLAGWGIRRQSLKGTVKSGRRRLQGGLGWEMSPLIQPLKTGHSGATSQTVATCGGEAVCVIDCQTGIVLHKYKAPGEVSAGQGCPTDSCIAAWGWVQAWPPAQWPLSFMLGLPPPGPDLPVCSHQ